MENEIKQIVYGNCWIAYFDILGFKKLVGQYKGNIDSFSEVIYTAILKEIIDRSSRISKALGPKVDYAWFSDTFILFTNDDTFASYSSMEIVLYEIFQKMMFSKHPLRGAISVGEFYVNKERNTYVGPALIDVHEYAENQQWIGMVLAPEAHKKLSETGYAINTTIYSEYEVPIKQKKVETEKLFALNICRFKNYIIQMQEVAKNEKDYEEKLKVKYDNTMKFIENLERSTGCRFLND